jgi:hypothetical protein
VYKLKLVLDNIKIYAQGSLIVIFSIKLNFKLRATLNKVRSLVLTNYFLVADCKQRIGYLLDVSKLGRISLLYQLWNMPNNLYLFRFLKSLCLRCVVVS